MGLFQTATKFAGFATEKVAAKGVAAVPGEAAAFIKGLEGAEDAIRFVHTEEEGFRQISAFKGETKLGNLKYGAFGEGYTVKGIYGSVKGVGSQLRSELARTAKAEGKKFLISDVYGSMSFDEMESWNRLKKMGHSIMEVNVPYAELGLKGREGGKFAFKWILEEGAAAEVAMPRASAEAAARQAGMLATAEKASKQMLEAGRGNDTSTLLNRSINSTMGSRRTSSAL